MFAVALAVLVYVAPERVMTAAEPKAAPSDGEEPFRQSKQLTTVEIARLAFPSVVLLSMNDDNGQPLCMGSGFFIDKDIVATNFHVIDQAASGYAKRVGESSKLIIKGIVGVDPLHDLALIQVAASAAPPLPIAAKLTVNVGDPVYAIGNPLGLEATFSPGVVSGFRESAGLRVLQMTAPISTVGELRVGLSKGTAIA